MENIRSHVSMLNEERMRALAQRPNTSVYTVQHTSTHTPWKAERVRRVAHKIVEFAQSSHSQSSTTGDLRNDEHIRQNDEQLLADTEVAEFKLAHPNLFSMLVNHHMISDTRFHEAFETLLRVREDVESGRISELEADSRATASLMCALAAHK